MTGRLEAERIEDVELKLRTPERGRGDTALGQVPLGLAGDVARVAAVRLAAPRLDDVAGQDHRRDVECRVDIGRGGVGHQQHVRLVDVLEAADARSVEADPVDEEVLTELLDRDAEVLGLAGQVDEAQVDDQDARLAGQGHDVGDGRGRRGDIARDPLEGGHCDRVPPSGLCIPHQTRRSCTSGGNGIRTPGCGSVPATGQFLVHFA